MEPLATRELLSALTIGVAINTTTTKKARRRAA
jgi:hypothetical protein